MAGVPRVSGVDVIRFPDRDAKIGLSIGLANGIIKSEKPGFSDLLAKYKDVLKRYDSIPRALDYAARALGPYEEYLE